MLSSQPARLLLLAYSRHVRLSVIELTTGYFHLFHLFHLFLVCLGGYSEQWAHHTAHISLLEAQLQIAADIALGTVLTVRRCSYKS